MLKTAEKRKEGRPSKFPTINKTQLKKLVLSGWDDKQISDFYGIAVSTLTRWKQKNHEFRAAVKDWKAEADVKVEQALYKRAIGFEYDEVTYEKSKTGGLGIMLKKGEVEAIKAVDTYKTKVVTKLIVPDVLAETFWLKNRQPDKWREKTELVLPVELSEALNEARNRLINYGKIHIPAAQRN